MASKVSQKFIEYTPQFIKNLEPVKGIFAATLTPYTDNTCEKINYDLIGDYAKVSIFN